MGRVGYRRTGRDEAEFCLASEGNLLLAWDALGGPKNGVVSA